MAGVEVSAEAVQYLCAWHPKMQQVAKGTHDGYERYAHEDLSLFQGNFLMMTSPVLSLWGPPTAVWDCGGLSAVPVLLQPMYVGVLVSVCCKP